MTEPPPPFEPSRDALRSRRKREVRALTVSRKRMLLRDRIHLRLVVPEATHEGGFWRPRTRGDCEDVPRPCPYVGCKWNLFLDVSDHTGSIKFNFPDLEPDAMAEGGSCVLDVIDSEGAVTLERTGELMNVTRERVRQLEVKHFPHLKRLLKGIIE